MGRIKFILLLVFSCCGQINSQINLQFVKHLSISELKEDHLFYLENTSSTKDSINYLKCKFYLQYPNDTLFFKHFSLSEKLVSQDPFLLNQASIYYLKQNNQFTDQWINLLIKTSADCNTVRQFVFLLQNSATKTIPVDSKIMAKDFREYKKMQVKKPILAASMSAIVPGLGKAYIGRKNAFIYTLAAHLIVGVQTYESVKRLGIKNPVSIFNMGMFGLMYSANIYGSFIETKKIKREKYHQLLTHASDYFYRDFGNSLYP